MNQLHARRRRSAWFEREELRKRNVRVHSAEQEKEEIQNQRELDTKSAERET